MKSVPVFALILTVASVATWAQPAPGSEAKKDGRHHRMWAELNLNEDQKNSLKALHQEMQELREKHMEAVRTVRSKIKTELLKPEPSQNVLYGYAGELGELHKQMSKDRGDHLLKVKKVLTPDQFVKLVEKENRMGGKGWKGKGKTCPHKRGPCGGYKGDGSQGGNTPPREAD